MAEERERSAAAAVDLAGELGWLVAVLAVVFVVQEVAHRVTGWDRLWILLVVVPLAWSAEAVARRWWGQRSARGDR